MSRIGKSVEIKWFCGCHWLPGVGGKGGWGMIARSIDFLWGGENILELASDYG